MENALSATSLIQSRVNLTHSDPLLLDENGMLPSLRIVITSGRISFTLKGNSMLSTRSRLYKQVDHDRLLATILLR